MLSKLHKTFFLLKLLGICVLLLLLHRILFLVLFYDTFNDVAFSEFCKAFLLGSLTDAITSIYFLLPMWLVLVFGNIENKYVKLFSKTWFLIGFSLVCTLNLSDLGYYPITKKRMGAELLDMLSEVPALLGSYLKDYWYLFFLLIGFVGFAFFLVQQQLNRYRNSLSDIKFKILNGILSLFLFFTIIRGGYGVRPFMPFDIPSYVDPKLQWLASNTPFQFIHTLENKNIPIENYFSEEEAEKNIEFTKQFSSKPFLKKNVLIIILESFATERIGLFNPAVKAYTPFLDSLLSEARTYKYSVANSQMTIDALPSVLSGIPSFMDKNYCYTNYNNNIIHGIAPLLKQEGYSTAFFYGGLKSTFGFENFINLNFSSTYIAQEDYNKPYENSGWGVDDDLYLPFIASKLKTLPQPFCASLLTLSLHHPFPVPEPYKTLLDTIKNPIKKSMKYTDISLRLFFNEIKNEPWFKNSIIAISADHNSEGFGDFEGNSVNAFSIPISFLAVGDSAFNQPQNQSISQIDIYPTLLDYLGYPRQFISLGNSALLKQHPTIQYIGNGIYQIFDYPFALQFDNNTQKIVQYSKLNEYRKTVDLPIDSGDTLKIKELTKQVKSYIQVFSYRVNKNQF